LNAHASRRSTEGTPVTETQNGSNGVERRFNAVFIELSIRLFLIGVLIYWTFVIVQPFAAMLVWSVVLAVAFYPLFEPLSRRLGGRPVIAAALMTIAGLLLVVGPAAFMGVGVIDPVKSVIAGFENGDLSIPPPPDSVRDWPIVGQQIYSFWELASTNLRSALAQVLPQLKPIGEYLLGALRSAGVGTLKFLLSILLAGFMLAYGADLLAAVRALARRVDPRTGDKYVDLAGATINAVSRGVMGLSLVQGILGGIGMTLAGTPGASLLAITIFVLGIIQIGPLIIVAPVIIWAWMKLTTGPALALTLCMAIVNYMDNFLKPFLLSRGLSTPMPVIFIGVIGGVLAHGVAGLFAGPVVLAVVWELARAWISDELEGRASGGPPQPIDRTPKLPPAQSVENL
jgi:predicted PurR-regulated permease PerM